MNFAQHPSRKRSELPEASLFLTRFVLVGLHFARGGCGHSSGGYNQMRTNVISSLCSLIWLLGSLCLLAACGQTASTSPTPTATVGLDVYGTPISIPAKAPQRIVSLVPSMSEILAALNLTHRVVGVDYETNYPAALAKVQKISDINGMYNVESIVALRPDLVLSSGGLSKTYDAQLTRSGLHVVDLPPVDFQQSLQQIITVGRLTYTTSTATALVNQLNQQMQQIENSVKGTTAPKVLLEVDDSTPGKPYVFGGGSFGDQMLQESNAVNIFHADSAGSGYPQVTDESVIADNPQFIILTEDLQYGGNPQDVYKRTNWEGIAAVKAHQIYHINADIMQRPGPRLVEGLRCLAQVIHPGKFSGALPGYCTASV